MYLRAHTRRKDGKTRRYFTIVECERLAGGRGRQAARQLALFPDDREAPSDLDCEAVSIRLSGIELHRPRQWGGCFLALWLWDFLELDRFWQPRLEPSRKGTRWLNVLKMLTVYRLVDPGSEFRLQREWFDRSAIGDLLGEDASLAGKNTLYRCLDRLLPHKDEMFAFLRGRWQDLFGANFVGANFDVLLYDLTSTYFEANPSMNSGETKKAYGYSRDHRPDCQQVVIGLVVTPEKVFPSPTKSIRATRPTAQRCAAS